VKARGGGKNCLVGKTRLETDKREHQINIKKIDAVGGRKEGLKTKKNQEGREKRERRKCQ